MTQDSAVSRSEFQRHADQHLERLRASNPPEVLTVDGHPELVVQSAEGYQKLLESADRAESVRILEAEIARRAGARRVNAPAMEKATNEKRGEALPLK